MAASLLGLILALLLPISTAAGPLSLRLEQWPAWQLPAPLPRPSPGDDLIYPSWFEGDWALSSSDGISAEVHFERRADGAVVGARAANAMAIGRAVLGEELLEVEEGSKWTLFTIARVQELLASLAPEPERALAPWSPSERDCPPLTTWMG